MVMKTKVREEYQEELNWDFLEETEKSINIYDELDWDFLDVEDDDLNSELFRDVPTVDFKKRTKKELRLYSILSVTIVLTLLLLAGMLYYMSVGRYMITDGDASQTNDIYVELERVDGNQVDPEVIAEVSQVLTSYFNILKNASSYSVLNTYCMSSSVFYTTEESFREAMVTSYDKNDSNARALRCFASVLSIGTVSEVLELGEDYYVYLDMRHVDESCLQEYFYTYGTDLTKYFNTKDITEQNIVRYIVEVANTYSLPTAKKEICIVMSRTPEGNIVMMDDSFVVTQSITAYNYAVAEVTKRLGNTKATEQY